MDGLKRPITIQEDRMTRRLLKEEGVGSVVVAIYA
jgi:hypothetical protein